MSLRQLAVRVVSTVSGRKEYWQSFLLPGDISLHSAIVSAGEIIDLGGFNERSDVLLDSTMVKAARSKSLVCSCHTVLLLTVSLLRCNHHVLVAQ